MLEVTLSNLINYNEKTFFHDFIIEPRFRDLDNTLNPLSLSLSTTIFVDVLILLSLFKRFLNFKKLVTLMFNYFFLFEILINLLIYYYFFYSIKCRRTVQLNFIIY